MNVANGNANVTVGMSQSHRCCNTVKTEKVSATNGGRRQPVHKMFTNAYPAFCRENVRCKEKDKQKFYSAHEADFIINDAAKRQLDKLGAPKQLPKRKDVVAEIQSLISEKNECYNDYREKSDRLHELMTMQRNYQMSMPQLKRGRSHEQER